MAHVITQPSPTAPDAPPGRRERRRAWRGILVGWSFILPNFVGFALFTLIPMLAAFVLAFLEWDSYSAPEWVGLDNFQRLLGDENFHVALRNTLYYAAGHIPLTLVVALGLAMALNRKIRGVQLFRTAAFFPYITSLVAVAVVWNMLFNPTAGPINQFLEAVGVADPPRWVASTDWAMPAVIVTSVWRDMGYYMVLYLAGLQTIPQEYYEAARVDGANAWQRFWSVTLPCLRPTTFFVVVMLTIQSFKVLDLIVVMTDGGPGRSTLVLAQLVYREGITEGQFGYSSAIALVLFLIVLIVTAVQFRLNERRST
ncbi:carbohydrate ABC transporter permease [Nonomuraea basaltis]|uniref:carbohydrate ABC transporter permease n=1 Tax=Nonomuraea basaltis TaxID=2495887 RepID=UPI00110C7171|nr:sugar ABC transporter permease [Nonomuraea basaltis]TMR96338.1 sugar ABC transporter permease [Nonomuraea basaltis]